MSLILLTFVVCLCAYAAATDVKRLQIDNWVSLALIALFMVYGLLYSVVWGAHLTVMLVMFVLGLLLHKTGIMGGGDIKLLVALSLWAGLSHLPALLVGTSLAGAVVALGTLMLQKKMSMVENRLPAQTSLAWVDGARGGGNKVAYGVAILCGALLMVSDIGGLI